MNKHPEYGDMDVHQQRACDRALAALEAMAEVWAAEVGLHQIAAKIAHAPIERRVTAVRDMFVQSFVEGAYRHFLDHESGKCVEHTPEWAKERIAALELVHESARRIVERVLAVYNPAYIEECVRKDPDSLLALVKGLEAKL